MLPNSGRLKKGLMISATTLVATFGLGAATATHVAAGVGPSQNCTDGLGNDDVPLVNGPAVWVGLDTSLRYDNPSYFNVCYSTTAPGYGGPQTAGGVVGVSTSSGPQAYCLPDANPSGVAVSCSAGTNPTATLSPPGCTTGTSGCLLSVAVPFASCLGQCEGASPGLAPTGALVGQLQTQSVQSTGERASLTGTQVWVDGIQVASFSTPIAGAGVGTINPSAGTSSTGSLCIFGLCEPVPTGGVEVGATRGGQPLLEIDLPTGNEYVSGCVVNLNMGCP